ncbi:MAG: metal transporter permease [Bacteroidetes bacterium]|nr:metal transporter permease [Bacteroidota bacterium]
MGISDAVTTLLGEFPYAVYGSVLVGVLCAVLGVYIVARRVVFFGAVLTQVSLVGVALTFIPPLDVLGHTGGALSLTAFVALLLSGLLTDRKVPRDAVLGVVFVSAVALRMLILQRAEQVEVAEVENLMRGDILFVTPGLFLFTLVLSVAAMALMLLLARPFAFMGLDPETAEAQGFRVRRWEQAFYLLTALVVAAATHLVGDLFVFAFLVVPPVAGLLLAKRVRGIVLVSALLGVFCPLVGLVVAFVIDVPATPAIVAVAGIVLLVAWVFNRIRR